MKIGNIYLYTVCSTIYIGTCTNISSDGKKAEMDNGSASITITDEIGKFEDVTELVSSNKNGKFVLWMHKCNPGVPFYKPSCEEWIEIRTGSLKLSIFFLNHDNKNRH